MNNLVTAEEAVALARYCDVSYAHFAVDVVDECIHSNQSIITTHERKLLEAIIPCYIAYTLSAVFNAGRIQGIREERARRASK